MSWNINAGALIIIWHYAIGQIDLSFNFLIKEIKPLTTQLLSPKKKMRCLRTIGAIQIIVQADKKPIMYFTYLKRLKTFSIGFRSGLLAWIENILRPISLWAICTCIDFCIGHPSCKIGFFSWLVLNSSVLGKCSLTSSL